MFCCNRAFNYLKYNYNNKYKYKPPSNATPFTMLALQGLKYSVDETSPLDTIQVSNSCKQSSFVALG